MEHIIIFYAPTDLAAEAGESSGLILTWKDNSKIEDGYIIERKQNSQSSFSVIDTLLGSGSEYIDNNVEEALNYTYRIKAYKDTLETDYSNETSILVDITEEAEKIPAEYSLSQNYPNPFNPTTNIKFALSKPAPTKISVYDLLGRTIQTLLNRKLESGYYEINFNGDNLPSGVYLYRIQSGSFVKTKKMLLMK